MLTPAIRTLAAISILWSAAWHGRTGFAGPNQPQVLHEIQRPPFRSGRRDARFIGPWVEKDMQATVSCSFAKLAMARMNSRASKAVVVGPDPDPDQARLGAVFMVRVHEHGAMMGQRTRSGCTS